MRPETGSAPLPAAMAAAFVLGLAGAIAAGQGAPAAPASRAASCWSATPADLAPLACGEHGALAGIAA
jgi:hypothetical protein